MGVALEFGSFRTPDPQGRHGLIVIVFDRVERGPVLKLDGVGKLFDGYTVNPSATSVIQHMPPRAQERIGGKPSTSITAHFFQRGLRPRYGCRERLLVLITSLAAHFFLPKLRAIQDWMELVLIASITAHFFRPCSFWPFFFQ